MHECSRFPLPVETELMRILSVQPIDQDDMNPLHHSVDLIVRAINGHVTAKGGDYTAWRIGRREPTVVAALSMTKSIPVTDCWGCEYADADRVMKHFLEKGMVRDDSPMQNNAAKGVYTYQVS